MSAPAALAMSKLFYPETMKSKTTSEIHINVYKEFQGKKLGHVLTDTKQTESKV